MCMHNQELVSNVIKHGADKGEGEDTYFRLIRNHIGSKYCNCNTLMSLWQKRNNKHIEKKHALKGIYKNSSIDSQYKI
jgi:two-component sensor histidine kinase